MAWESLYDNFIAEYYDASPIVTRRGDPAFYVNVAKEFWRPGVGTWSGIWPRDGNRGSGGSKKRARQVAPSG